MNRSILRTGTLLGMTVALGLTASACASHRFVRDNVAVVDARVDRTDARLGQTETRVARVEGTAGEALQRANAAHQLAEGKFLYEVVLSDDSVKFPVNGDELSPEAQQRLAELTNRLKAENQNVYLEIQGHSDATGPEEANVRLGEQRAEAVRRFLSQGGIALNRMSTISYGSQSPVASNDTRDGRSQNRRVAIVVLT